MCWFRPYFLCQTCLKSQIKHIKMPSIQSKMKNSLLCHPLFEFAFSTRILWLNDWSWSITYHLNEVILIYYGTLFFLILILWRQWYYVLILFTMRMNLAFRARPNYSKSSRTWSLVSRVLPNLRIKLKKIVISWYILKCNNFLIKPEFRSSTIGISLKMQYYIWFIMKLEIADAICNILHEPLLLKNLHITNE